MKQQDLVTKISNIEDHLRNLSQIKSKIVDCPILRERINLRNRLSTLKYNLTILSKD